MGKKSWELTQELEAKVVGLLREGESFTGIALRPGMPCRDTLTRWGKVFPDFARRCGRAREEFVREARERTMREICAQTEMGRSLLRICAGPGMPDRRTVSDWRREFPKFAEDFRQAKQTRRDFLQAGICEHVAKGRSLRSLRRVPGMPWGNTVAGWVARRPDFGWEFAEARELGMGKLETEMLAIADDLTIPLAVARLRIWYRWKILSRWLWAERRRGG